MNSDKMITTSFTPVAGITETGKTLNHTIRPNPSNGVFHIHMDQPGDCTYFIYSMKGSLIKQGMAAGEFEIDLSDVEKGIYLLKIKSDQVVDVKKIILK